MILPKLRNEFSGAFYCRFVACIIYQPRFKNYALKNKEQANKAVFINSHPYVKSQNKCGWIVFFLMLA